MVQVIENRADLDGRVLDIRDDPMRPGHKLAMFEVDTVHSVAPFPNLLGEAQGQSIEVVMPAEQADALKQGDAIRCSARRTGPTTVFVEQCKPLP
jgi:hypothetical protein